MTIKLLKGEFRHRKFKKELILVNWVLPSYCYCETINPSCIQGFYQFFGVNLEAAN